MAVVVAETPTEDGRAAWSRRYPPLIALVVGLLIAILVLPSALRLPQTNPTQTAEYAPVPPDNKTPPNKGNVAALGLGNAATIGDEAPPPAAPKPGVGPLPPPASGLLPGGKTPTTKQCVRDRFGVLRQTDDPLSPPCVADFRGDNFGATYQGVTGNEIRILVYLQGAVGHTNDCATPNEQAPQSVYFDLAQPPDPNKPEGCELIALRGWQRYFNDRYQTYGRFVHFFAYFSGSINSDSPEARRADAADNYAQVHPFAVISYVPAYEDDYLKAMVERHVLNFGSFNGKDQSFFTGGANKSLVWSYTPSQQQAAASYVSYICTKVAGKPVSFSGDGHNGQPRKYGLLYTSDADHPELPAFKDLVKAELQQQCGVTIAAEATYPKAGYGVDTVDTPAYAQQNMAQFKSSNITTILWPGGLETKQSGAAEQIGYLPEWVVAGDGTNDGFHANQNQGAAAWAHAWIVSFDEYQPTYPEQICFQAFKSADPNAAERDTEHACGYYDNLRQLFTGIQVAGPRLGPSSIDEGFHAIKPIASYNPQVPACYYQAGDYTCIKDAAAEWWDSTGTPPGSSSAEGCWRMADQGQRYVAGSWPPGDVLSMRQTNDPCNGYGPVESLLLGAP